MRDVNAQSTYPLSPAPRLGSRVEPIGISSEIPKYSGLIKYPVSLLVVSGAVSGFMFTILITPWSL